MKSFSKLFGAIFLLALASTLAAQIVPAPQTRRPPKKVEVEKDIKLGEDEAGCKDSDLIARIPGCNIIQCDKKEVEDHEIQVGISQDGVPQKEAMDGQLEVIYYLCPARITLSSIVKMSENVVMKQGFKIIYAGKDEEDNPLVTGLKDTQWVQFSAYTYDDLSAYIQTTLKVPAENQISTDALIEEMGKNGRIAIAGLSFNKDGDFGDSPEKILGEVVAALVRQPDWRIRVEGYTNTEATAEGNVVLSQKEASAVASWLLEHGIDKSRVSIQGYGDAKQVADGNTPEGKVKNRRIEMAKF
jgi:outer membrane protein OmpA-like peptidoglycan-associated protein